MKEHRTKALRVTTTNNIHSKDEPDLFGSLQLLQLELSFRSKDCLMENDLFLSRPSSYHCHACNRITYNKHEDLRSDSREIQDCDSVPRVASLYISNCSQSDFLKTQRRDCVSHWSCSNIPKLGSSHQFSLSPLHSLLSGNLSSWSELFQQVHQLVTGTTATKEVQDWLSWTDSEGNTPLLIGARRLLKKGAFDQAVQLVQLLLDAGSDPDSKNDEGRTLLSYSVQYMDDSLQLTRLLINNGASVWPSGPENCSGEENGSSVFTWFLRGVMRRRKLDTGCLQTLTLLAQVMGECPNRMHSHVMRTMFRHAKCYRVLGPVFLQLKLAIASHWAQPQDLRFLCRRSIRQCLLNSPHRLIPSTIAGLGLPPQMVSYIMLE